MSATASGGRRLIVEADGGSRNNPGPAGYGAVVRDASTGEILLSASDFLGVATNNVAEYNGLLAGLKLAQEIDPAAFVEVRMDSRLVIEQMSGRWQVKHPDMRVLASEAAKLSSSFGPGHVSYTWIPRERNQAADRLANEAMDAGTGSSRARVARPAGAPVAPVAETTTPVTNRIVGWGPTFTATSLTLVRHGVTAFSVEKRFSGVGDPPLIEQGRLQAKAVAARLATRGSIDLIVTSPMSRCRETAAVIASLIGAPVEHDDDLREVDFGAWEGLTLETVQERWPRELAMWLADPTISPPEGESYDSLRYRISRAQQRLVNRHRGMTVCVVTHSRPVASFVASALSAPLESLYRLQVDNGSLTVLDYYEDGPQVLRTFNDTSHLTAAH
ncbi:MAG TPA: bifunctional RNase H/acid phosphatase [Acidothermaceae bacterium]|nr:bifunctional RNase H/acid phosphatase [Acidothermaceae bacterium]